MMQTLAILAAILALSALLAGTFGFLASASEPTCFDDNLYND